MRYDGITYGSSTGGIYCWGGYTLVANKCVLNAGQTTPAPYALCTSQATCAAIVHLSGQTNSGWVELTVQPSGYAFTVTDFIADATKFTCIKAALVGGGGPGVCDDGGVGSEYSACSEGTDCYDCGTRCGFYPRGPPSPPPSPPPI